MAHAADALGANHARLAIIYYLRDHPGADRTAITTRLAIGHQTVYSHLRGLEEAGIIHTDTQAGERHGRKVHYWLNRDELRLQLQVLLNELG